MASTLISLSNQSIGRGPSALRSPDRQTLRRSFRFSAGCAAEERASGDALRTASFYDVLGVRTGATREEIKSAYRKLARVLHPDVPAGGRRDDTSAAGEFMRVHAAYATLSDPEKRATYDRSLFLRRRAAVVPLGSGYTELTRRRRTWETDQCW